MWVTNQELAELDRFKFETSGFLFLPDWLSGQENKKLTEDFLSVYSDTLKVKELTKSTVSQVVIDLEANGEHDLLYAAMKNLSKSTIFGALSDKFENFGSHLLGKRCNVINTGIAVGLPNSNRTSYDWHQESPYYPSINTLHLQFPIAFPCTRQNGTMSVLEGSHKMGQITKVKQIDRGAKHTTSIVPSLIDSYMKIYEEFAFEMRLGDAYVFDQNLIHRSNNNYSEELRLAGIIRVEVTQ